MAQHYHHLPSTVQEAVLRWAHNASMKIQVVGQSSPHFRNLVSDTDAAWTNEAVLKSVLTFLNHGHPVLHSQKVASLKELIVNPLRHLMMAREKIVMAIEVDGKYQLAVGMMLSKGSWTIEIEIERNEILAAIIEIAESSGIVNSAGRLVRLFVHRVLFLERSERE